MSYKKPTISHWRSFFIVVRDNAAVPRVYRPAEINTQQETSCRLVPGQVEGYIQSLQGRRVWIHISFPMSPFPLLYAKHIEGMDPSFLQDIQITEPSGDQFFSSAASRQPVANHGSYRHVFEKCDLRLDAEFNLRVSRQFYLFQHSVGFS